MKVLTISIVMIISFGFCFAGNLKYPDDLKSSENFEQVMRLPKTTIENAVNDSFYVEYYHSSWFIIDPDSLMLGLKFRADKGGPKYFEGIAIFDQKLTLKKIIEDSLGIYYKFNIFKKEITNSAVVLGSDIQVFKQFSKNLEVKDITQIYIATHEEVKNNYRKKYIKNAKQYNLWYYDMVTPDTITFICEEFRYNQNLKFFIYNSSTKEFKEYGLKQYDFLEILNTPKYLKSKHPGDLLFEGVLNDQVCLLKKYSHLLFLINYKTGNKEIYDLEQIAKEFKIQGVKDYDELESGYCAFVSTTNIYLIFEGKSEIVVLRKKL